MKEPVFLLNGISIKLHWARILPPRTALIYHVLQSSKYFTDPTIKLPGSAMRNWLCRRDLGFFHVVSQSGKTNPVERNYKLVIVHYSCWKALTVCKREKLINPGLHFLFSFQSGANCEMEMTVISLLVKALY